jgi:hypothetical protein
VDLLSAFLDSIGHGALFCLKLLAFLLPILVAYHMATASGIFRGDSPRARRVLAVLGLSPASGAPLLAGLFLGIAYGAGILIPAARAGKLSRREVLRLCLFLCTCHAIPEDTLIFVLATSHAGWLAAVRLFVTLVAIRLALAVLVVRLAGRFVVPRLEPEGAA